MPKSFHLRTFDLNLLKVFDEVMAERSLTRAANRLALTQPAVSNAVRRLREALGDELLVRQGRTLEPTPHALALWPAVRSTLRDLEASLAPSAFVPAQSVDTFTLTMADATAAELLPGLLQTVQQQAPGVSLRVAPLTSRDPRPVLEEGLADLAIGHFPALVTDMTARAQSGVHNPFLQQRLFSGDYVCVMRHNHPMATHVLTLDDFCAAPHILVSFSGRAYGFIDEGLALHQRTRRVVLTVNQFFTAAQMVARSDLFSVLPRHFLPFCGFQDQLAQQALPFRVPPVDVHAVWHQRHDNLSAQRWLRAQVSAVVAQVFPTAT